MNKGPGPRSSAYIRGPVIVLAALCLAAACSKGDSAAAATGAPGAPGAASARTASITLAASDVAIVSRQPIEEATPITGDLRPIESVDVRAKLEGDLEAVYVREGEAVSVGQVLARFESRRGVSGPGGAVAH